jgi:DNA-binding transcriptional LysR family regulator
MLHLRADMLRAVAGPEAIGGVLRLGVAETIVHTWLARFLEQVHARHPGITLDISVDVSPNLRDALAGAELDLAFLLGPVSEPRMVNHPLASYPLAFAASPALDLGPEPVTVEALLRFPVITYPKTTRPYVLLREILRRPDLPAPRLYSSASLSTIVRMTLDCIGVSCIPPAVIGPELAEGRLRLVATDLPLPSSPSRPPTRSRRRRPRPGGRRPGLRGRGGVRR